VGEKKFVSTFDYPDSPSFRERSVVIPVKQCPSILEEIKHVFTILRAAKRARAMLLDSASGRLQPELLACIIMGFWSKPRRPVIIMAGDMWHKDQGLRGKLQTIILKLADRAIFRYAPLSREEFPYFSKAWGIAEKKLRFLPYFYTFTADDLQSTPPPLEDFVFAGGNTHRDYKPLIEAMESLPQHTLIIGSRLLCDTKLPPNVKAQQFVRDEYIRLMRAAQIVVIPIRQGLIRSTGHQTYLNAMLLKKPTIVNNILGVREYTKNGQSAIIVDGTPESYIEAIKKASNPENKTEIEQMCELGCGLASGQYTFENHANRLLEIIDEAITDYYQYLPQGVSHFPTIGLSS